MTTIQGLGIASMIAIVLSVRVYGFTFGTTIFSGVLLIALIGVRELLLRRE